MRQLPTLPLPIRLIASTIDTVEHELPADATTQERADAYAIVAVTAAAALLLLMTR